jgi:hypothetical protein
VNDETATSTSGAARFGLESSILSLTIDPARGARITSMVHRPSGQELLWRQPPLVDWPRYDAPETEADIQGWDECFPAIGPGPHPPGPWGTVQNPAQGEVYALPWQVNEVVPSAAILSVHGVRFPYALTRHLSFDGPDTLRLQYRAANHSAHPFPFIWSAHPLLTAPAGAWIELSDSVRSAIVDSSEGRRLGDAYAEVDWPEASVGSGGVTDLRVVRPGSGIADKLYVPRIEVGRCALTREDGATVTFTWDAQQIPSLGIWVDTRGEGEARVALEPCLGYPDRMDAAAEWGRYAVLPAHGEVEWEFAMTVSSRVP